MRIMLADDHPLFMEGLQYLLETHGICVAGTVVNGKEALERARELNPDIVLMDIKMPECDGIDALRLIKSEMPDTRIIMLTTSEDDEDVFEAIKYGASGYLLKNINAEELIRSLKVMENGEIELPFGLAPRILNEFRNNSGTGGNEPSDRQKEQEKASLTERQSEILEMVAAGVTYKAAGEKLGLSERTVKYHMGRIIELLHVKNKSQVIAYAASTGLAKIREKF